MAKTLYDKLVDGHTVRPLDPDGETVLLYVDRTVLNEYTSPQAFTGLRRAGRRVWRPAAALCKVDHVNPTAARRTGTMLDPGAARQAAYFAENCRDFGIELFDVLHPLQGIEHVVMTMPGSVLPGMVIAAGDSHTTTYGALGALGFGIGFEIDAARKEALLLGLDAIGHTLAIRESILAFQDRHFEAHPWFR